MEYLARTYFPIFNTRDVNDYLHATLCKTGKNRSGSTPYANKRNKRRKNKPKRNRYGNNKTTGNSRLEENL